MNKILISFLLCFSFLLAKAQYPQPPQKVGTANTEVLVPGGLFSDSTFRPPVYKDTSSTYGNANGSMVYKIPFAIIECLDGSGMWMRSADAKRWIQVGANAIPGTVCQGLFLVE